MFIICLLLTNLYLDLIKTREEILESSFQYIEYEIDLRVESIRQMAHEHGEKYKEQLETIKKEFVM